MIAELSNKMDKPSILIIEDDTDIANMLRIYLSGIGYAIEVAHRGEYAIERARQRPPDAIVADVALPDMYAYDVCSALRSNLGTSQIPFLFLTQKDERSDKLQGLELGADDYITKPFDIEEFRLRLQRKTQRQLLARHTQPVTGLPAGVLLEKQLRCLLDAGVAWAIIDLSLSGYAAFRGNYGSLAAGELLQFTARIIREVVFGLSNFSGSVIGHVRGGHFVVGVEAELALQVKDGLKYQFSDQLPFFLAAQEKTALPPLQLTAGLVLSSENQSANLHELIRLVAARCRTDEAAKQRST